MSGSSKDGKTAQQLFREQLEQLSQVEVPPRQILQEVMDRSDHFVITFPVQTARLKTLLKGGRYDEPGLEDMVNSAYPLVHERLLPLLTAFLHHKRTHGRRKERELYSSLGLLDLVDRLVRKRPVVFFTPHDNYILRDGTEGCGGFEKIGHSQETPKLCLQEYMSYDEIKLAALVSVSSKSHFINDGSRHNRGVPGAPGTYQPDGVIVGMVGARFEREGVMEWQDCMVTPEQNTRDHGYGDDPPPKRGLVQEWGRLWGETPLPVWEQVQTDSKDGFLSLSSKLLFNTAVYKARIQIAAETLLAEAGARAVASGLKAYIHVVGLGLGVWKATSQQVKFFMEGWAAALAAADTTHIAHVDFSWIRASECGGVSEGQTFPNTEVTLHFSKRSLHEHVPPGNLLVVSFAWDGNSLPGNEYWKGMLSASGDPAAACSSGVAELHNALINHHVTGQNLHVASPGRVEHVAQYARRLLMETKTTPSGGD